MVITYHIKELKFRVYYILISWSISSIVVYIYREPILSLFIKSLGTNLIFTSLAEGFLSFLSFSICIGFVAVIPQIWYQGYQYILPGLYEYEVPRKKLILQINVLLYIIGLIYMTIWFIPNIIGFFKDYQSQDILLFTPRIKDFISLITFLYISFFIVTTTPFFILAFYPKKEIHVTDEMNAYVGEKDAAELTKKNPAISSDVSRNKKTDGPVSAVWNYRQYLWFIILLISGIVTPPDILSQILLSFPIIILTELFFFFYFLMKRIS